MSALSPPSVFIARAVSLLAHPLPVATVALLILLHRDGAPASALVLAALVCLALGGTVIGVSRRHVRQGRWQHVDASHPDERRQLNRWLLILFGLGTTVSVIGNAWLAAGVFGGALLIVLLAIALQRWGKTSLHMAFAVFAAVLLQPGTPLAIGLMLAVLVAIGWSRLHLQRHTPVDLLLGIGCGVLAGAFGRWLPSAAGG